MPIKYEFLKILRKKSTIVVMLVSLLVTAFFSDCLFCNTILCHRTQSTEGLRALNIKKEQYENISVPLTDEYITQSIQEVQQLFKNPDNIGYDGQEQFLIDDAWNGIVYRESLLDMIAKTLPSRM